MENHVIQIIPCSVTSRCEAVGCRKGGGTVKKDITREAIEAKLRYARMELETAGFIHSRDLRKHIHGLEKMLKRMKSE